MCRCRFVGGPWGGRVTDLQAGSSGLPPVVWKVAGADPRRFAAPGDPTICGPSIVEHLYERANDRRGAVFVYYYRDGEGGP